MLKAIKRWWNQPSTSVEELCELTEACGILKAQNHLASHFEGTPERTMTGLEVAEEIRKIVIRKNHCELPKDAGI